MPDSDPPRRLIELDKRELIDLVTSLEHERLNLIAQVSELEIFREEAEHQQSELLGAQHALEESRDRYADLYDFAPIAYLTLDPHGIIKEANLTTSRMLGLERSNLLNRPLLSFVFPDDRSKCMEHLRRCRMGEDVSRTELRMSGLRKQPVPVEMM